MVINLTMHPASAEQADAGVVAGPPRARELLIFADLPSRGEVFARAKELAQIATESGCEAALIGGAPYLMRPLELCLAAKGVQALYAFSRRESVEKVEPDGSTTKVAVFRHLGFVQGRPPNSAVDK